MVNPNPNPSAAMTERTQKPGDPPEDLESLRRLFVRNLEHQSINAAQQHEIQLAFRELVNKLKAASPPNKLLPGRIEQLRNELAQQLALIRDARYLAEEALDMLDEREVRLPTLGRNNSHGDSGSSARTGLQTGG